MVPHRDVGVRAPGGFNCAPCRSSCGGGSSSLFVIGLGPCSTVKVRATTRPMRLHVWWAVFFRLRAGHASTNHDSGPPMHSFNTMPRAFSPGNTAPPTHACDRKAMVDRLLDAAPCCLASGAAGKCRVIFGSKARMRQDPHLRGHLLEVFSNSPPHPAVPLSMSGAAAPPHSSRLMYPATVLAAALKVRRRLRLSNMHMDTVGLSGHCTCCGVRDHPSRRPTIPHGGDTGFLLGRGPAGRPVKAAAVTHAVAGSISPQERELATIRRHSDTNPYLERVASAGCLHSWLHEHLSHGGRHPSVMHSAKLICDSHPVRFGCPLIQRRSFFQPDPIVVGFFQRFTQRVGLLRPPPASAGRTSRCGLAGSQTSRSHCPRRAHQGGRDRVGILCGFDSTLLRTVWSAPGIHPGQTVTPQMPAPLHECHAFSCSGTKEIHSRRSHGESEHVLCTADVPKPQDSLSRYREAFAHTARVPKASVIPLEPLGFARPLLPLFDPRYLLDPALNRCGSLRLGPQAAAKVCGAVRHDLR